MIDERPIGDTGRWRLYWDVAVPTPNPSNRAYLVNRTDRTIEVMDGDAAVASWPVDGIPTRAAVGPDGSLFVLTAEGLVWKLDAAGQTVAGWDAAAFTVGKTDVADLAVGPDGRVY